jgi:hypothetical protein
MPPSPGSPRVGPGPPVRIGLLLVLALLLTTYAGPPAAVGAQAGPSLPAYSLEVDLDYEQAAVTVDQRVRFQNQTGQALDRIVFQAAPAALGIFQLERASLDGQPVETLLDGSVLELLLPTALAPGASVEPRLEFSLDVPRLTGRIGVGQQALTLAGWFPLLAPHRGDWLRFQYTDVGDAFVSEVADFAVKLSTSRPLVVASTGRQVEGGSPDTRFRLQASGVRDFALSLSPAYQTVEAQADGVTVRAFTTSAARGRTYAQAAARFLAWYAERLGPYPYRALSLAEANLPTSFAGLEYPGLILLTPTLGEPSPFEGSPPDYLIGHEVAHQWFYSLVGNDQVADPWLDEAFAQYLPYWYYRGVAPGRFAEAWNRGVAGGLDGRGRAAGGQTVDATVFDFPSDGPYFTAVYRQGAFFLDRLRQTMGEAAFEAALRDQVATFGDKLATPLATLDLFQRHSPVDLTELYAGFFAYRAYLAGPPGEWRVELPTGRLRGRIGLRVAADFPLSNQEVWLDHRLLASGQPGAVDLDLAGVASGEYVLLTRVQNERGAWLERAQRVEVGR